MYKNTYIYELKLQKSDRYKKNEVFERMPLECGALSRNCDGG